MDEGFELVYTTQRKACRCTVGHAMKDVIRQERPKPVVCNQGGMQCGTSGGADGNQAEDCASRRATGTHYPKKLSQSVPRPGPGCIMSG